MQLKEKRTPTNIELDVYNKLLELTDYSMSVCKPKQKLNNEKRKLRRMKESKVAFEQVFEHYRCVRAAMKKGNRSGVVKLDRYFNRLFRKELTEYADKKE